MLTDADRVPLGSRSWIGDGNTGATVTADGTIDWYCPERFDAPAALGRLLDPAAGAIRLGPVRRGSSARRTLPDTSTSYLPGTLVARTVTRGPGFATELTDVMPWSGSSATSPGRIVRTLRALAGPVDVEIEVVPGVAYGPGRTAHLARWSGGMVTGPLQIRAGLVFDAVAVGRDSVVWRATRRLESGESMVVTVDRPRHDRHAPLSPDAARRVTEESVDAWRFWVAGLTYQGPYRAAVERSALLIKALTWTGGGAPVDAGTLGLPRQAGGERNADGRAVSLRLAAGVARTFGRIGFEEDAEGAERWLRDAIEGSALPWPSRLDVDGSPLDPPAEIPVAGWRRSQPVSLRGGLHLDLDVVGDVVGAISASGRSRTEGAPDRAGPLSAAWPALVAGADRLVDHWSDPDGGVWSLGGPPRRLVASHLQAWCALSGMATRAWAANPLDLAAVAWHDTARDIVRWCEREAVAADGGLVLDPGPAEHPDAALLRLAWAGPWPAFHPIVSRTVDRILDRLGVGSLIHRYPAAVDDGLAGSDGPDVEASLWAVRALASLERWEEAHERMEAVCSLGGTTGILGTAAEATTGEIRGNLPAAGAHLALIEAALALQAGPG